MEIETIVTKIIYDSEGNEIHAGDKVAFSNARNQSVVGIYDGIDRGNLSFKNILNDKKFAVSPRLISDIVLFSED